MVKYGFRARDIADIRCEGRNSVTRWLNRGLCDERDDPEFNEQINRLDAEISHRRQWCIAERDTHQNQNPFEMRERARWLPIGTETSS